MRRPPHHGVTFITGSDALRATLQQGSRREEAVVLKFGPDRLGTQSEFLGYELAAHVGVATPPCVLLRRGQAEWKALGAAAEALGPAGEALRGWLASARAALLVGFAPGAPLGACEAAWAPGGPAEATAEALGAVLLLDLLLANADRLPLPSLGWRGNAANLRYGPPKPPSAVSPPLSRARHVACGIWHVHGHIRPPGITRAE